jgi:hypothetical protein
MSTKLLETERIAVGMYRVFDENGYVIAKITKRVHNSASRRWIVVYSTDAFSAFPTLKSAVAFVSERWISS